MMMAPNAALHRVEKLHWSDVRQGDLALRLAVYEMKERDEAHSRTRCSLQKTR